MMRTLGIDLSSQPKGTAACVIEWRDGVALVSEPHLRCDDDKLDDLIKSVDAVGIDAPFGWPIAFENAVGNWTSKKWDTQLRGELQYRETDRFVRDKVEKWWPLSVSSDRIALPAMRAMALLTRHRVTDKSGDGKFYEVYPAGSLKCWGLESRGYKDAKNETCLSRRINILAQMKRQMPWLRIPGGYLESADALDALIASLTARAAKTAKTWTPEKNQVEKGRREGWIHLPRIGQIPEVET